MVDTNPTPTAGASVTYVQKSLYRQVGMRRRIDRAGSEFELVKSFLAHLPWDTPPGTHLTVFEQPRLASGFPDIVLVLWDTAKTLSWSATRADLQPMDVRLAHHLVTSGPARFTQLLAIFGRWIPQSVERLIAARMIYQRTGLWRAKKLEKIFAVQQIIALEAKINALSDAVAQASRNRWFASHSFIIVPSELRDTRSIRRANQFGIGIWCLQGSSWVCHVPSAVHGIPRSYASWLFNEWAWRIAKLGPDGAMGGR